MGVRARLESRQQALRDEIGRLKAELKLEQQRAKFLERDLQLERLQRISAQRGLVSYMKEHDLGHRIGYDPDQDQSVLVEIAAGRIPPLENSA